MALPGEAIRPQAKKRRNDPRTSSIFSVLRAPIRLAMSEECIVNSLVAFTIDGLGSRPSAKSPRQRWTAFGSFVMGGHRRQDEVLSSGVEGIRGQDQGGSSLG